MLVGIRMFGSKSRASKRLRHLVARKQLRLAGTVVRTDGRPEHVFCRGTWVKADNLLHELEISRLCFKTHAGEVRRGPGRVDCYLLPDAEFTINGKRYLLELDRGTMSCQAIAQTRFEKYASVRDLVLWVCPTGERMEELRRLSALIRETALFTTLDQALRNPHAPIWMDFNGEMAALPVAEKGA
jgi:hypothetical protein